MRKSFYALSGVVNSFMNQVVRDGGVLIFINRHQNVMKILHMEYAGLVIYHKRLESGRFKLPAFDENTSSITINWQDHMAMVQSVRIRSVKHHKIVNFFGIEEFYDACRDLHSDEADPALMFQDLENIPSALIGESWLAEDILEIIEAVSNLGETE